jgi:hypothetical protein
LSLPQEIIILITELLNPNFCIGSLIDFQENLINKQLYFDIINIDKEKYLLIGTTCYQLTNKAKNYLKKLKL